MSVSSQTKRVSATLEAAFGYWGYGQCRKITCVADVADSLNNTWFDLNVLRPNAGVTAEDLGYVWFNTGAGVDPAPAGKVFGIEVSISTDATAAEVRDALVVALEAADYVFAKADGAEDALVENWYPGAVTAETDGGSTGFTFAVERAGVGGGLGATSEGIELALTTETFDITGNQFGNIIVDQVLLGNAAEMTMSLLEMTQERWESLVGTVAGDKLSPASGEDIVGFGESKLYRNLNDLSGRLILHPQRLAETDRSADWVMWLSAPIPESVNFDGQNPQVLGVTFRPYLDSSIDQGVNLVARGDWSKSELRV